MIRCLKTDFKTSCEELDRLFACNRISALIWNKCLDVAREYRLSNDGAWISKGDLQKAMKGLYPLYSQSVQSVAERYCDARLGAKQARDKGLNNRYPWRHKHAYPTRWKEESISIVGNTVFLKLAIWNKHRQKPIKLKIPDSTAKFLRDKKIKLID